MQILVSSEKKKITEKLNEQFGISDIPYLFLQFGKEKIRLYSGSLLKQELNFLDNNLRIEIAGLYFAAVQQDGIRLTLDGSQIIKNQITKNILEIADPEAEKWLRGNDLEIKEEKTFKIISNNGEILGCGKSTGERITNNVPKERRIKNPIF